MRRRSRPAPAGSDQVSVTNAPMRRTAAGSAGGGASIGRSGNSRSERSRDTRAARKRTSLWSWVDRALWSRRRPEPKRRGRNGEAAERRRTRIGAAEWGRVRACDHNGPAPSPRHLVVSNGHLRRGIGQECRVAGECQSRLYAGVSPTCRHRGAIEIAPGVPVGEAGVPKLRSISPDSHLASRPHKGKAWTRWTGYRAARPKKSAVRDLITRRILTLQFVAISCIKIGMSQVLLLTLHPKSTLLGGTKWELRT